ncbi:replication-relaxation family protein [Nocardia sp. alder85J]|uniref:replication-relaxation family protein n=1 Tax=Nocardia sp. alder85J TaxID=2862949 RepID=UPI001CD609BF|nr:replication-relaxation family protein [Nocardia sp. alder85J]MCX4098059.1 replication-relaxation family protein [Nocardia sp. alder85J]
MKQLDLLRERLSDRDIAILRDVELFRLLTTRQLRRLHFTTGHQTIDAATRACTRVLKRLRDHDLIVPLRRRIGGVRQGSAGLTWQLDTMGERLLRYLSQQGHRRRYREPSKQFIDHTLAVAGLGVDLREAEERGRIELVELAVEGTAYRSFVGAHGAKETLKPDLHAITATEDFESHWLIEADRGSEHSPHLLRKLNAYYRYLKTGRYQAEHGLFPSVLWVVPDDARRSELATLIGSEPLPQDLFQICTFDGFIDFVIAKTLGVESLPLPGVLDSTMTGPPQQAINTNCPA